MIIIQILYRLLPKNGNEKHSFCTMLSLDHDITRFSKDGFIHQVRDYLYAHFNKTNASMSLATLRYPVSYKLNTFFSKKMFYQNNSPQQQQHFTMGSGSNKLSWLDFNSHSIIVTVYDSHGDSIATEMEYSRVLNWKLDLQQTADGLGRTNIP